MFSMYDLNLNFNTQIANLITIVTLIKKTTLFQSCSALLGYLLDGGAFGGRPESLGLTGRGV